MINQKSDQHNQKFHAIGLMSGTSADGVDVALIETDGHGFVKYIAGDGLIYSPELRAKIMGVFGHKAPADAPGFNNLARELTVIHGDAAEKLIDKTGVRPDIIGFHGQTIWHDPPKITSDGTKILGKTCQIGQGQFLADRCGVDVVDDFRSADMRAGGHGAPLLPLYHRALLIQNKEHGLEEETPVIILNLGGVANVTAMSGLGDGQVLAFDAGPANALMDDLVMKEAGLPYDKNGAFASDGRADQARVKQWLDDPFFAQPPPKSLDRDYWREKCNIDDLALNDALASLTMFSVLCVKNAVDLSTGLLGIKGRIKLYVAGGGRHNQFMMAQLRQNLTPHDIDRVDVLGWDGDSLEAQGFAYLAVRSFLGLPLSLPGTTGCDAPVTGGVVHRPLMPQKNDKQIIK